MKPFDRRLENDLFPKTPAAFRRTVQQTLANVCERPEAAEDRTVRFPTTESGRKSSKKRTDLFARIGTVAVAAVLVISLLAVGTIAVLAKKTKTTPAVNVPSYETIEPIWTQKAEVVLLPDYTDRETGENYSTFAALREANGAPAYSEEMYSWIKALESATVYMDLNGRTLECETVFSIPNELRGDFEASPINGDAYAVTVEADAPRFVLDDTEEMPAEPNLAAWGFQYYYSDVTASREEMDPWQLAVGHWYVFYDAFMDMAERSRTLTIQTTYRVYDRAYLNQAGDDEEALVLNRKCALVGVVEQTVEIDLEKLMEVDAEYRAELALSGTHTLTVMYEEDDGTCVFSDGEQDFDGLVLNETVQYRATGLHVTLSCKDLPEGWEKHYGTSLLYPSAWVAENMYGLSAKLVFGGPEASSVEARAMEGTDENKVVFIFPVAADDARLNEYGAELCLYLKARTNEDAEEICRTALPLPTAGGQSAADPEPIEQAGGTDAGGTIADEPIETASPAVIVGPDGYQTVYAATVDEFLQAIEPNTEIILSGEIYNLTAASDYGTDGGRYYTWRKVADGYELYLQNLENFRLIGSENTQVVTEPRYAAVIDAENCTNLTFMNFTAGHTPMTDTLCSGPVLQLSDCTNARVENCGLFGCGRVGVGAHGCNALTVTGCDIYECSNEGIDLFECRNVVIDACKLRDCGLRKLSDDTEPYGASDIFFIGSCEHIIIKDCDVFGNKALSVIGCAQSKDVFLYGTLVYDNELNDVISIEDAEMTVFGCEFRHSGNILYKTSYPYKILDQDGSEIGETELMEMKLERTVSD